MSPSPTNSGNIGKTGNQVSTGQPGGPTPSQLQACQTAQALPPNNTDPNNHNGGTIFPPAKLPATATPPPKVGYTPSTAPPDTGAGGAGAPPSRIQSLLSLVQPGVLGNTSIDPLFRLTYRGALGLGQSGDQKDPIPLFNPYSGAKS